jgi:uncharacterized membrane-anchored protein
MLATTLGENGGDAVSMSMNLGYLVGTEIFRPVIDWTTIFATTTVSLPSKLITNGYANSWLLNF